MKIYRWDLKKKEEILRYLIKNVKMASSPETLYTAAEGIKVMLKMRNVYFIFFISKKMLWSYTIFLKKNAGSPKQT